MWELHIQQDATRERHMKGTDRMTATYPRTITCVTEHPTETYATLRVGRDMMHGGRWRLYWYRDGDTSYVAAEGECSARLFHRMSDAIAFGRRTYGETATRWSAALID